MKPEVFNERRHEILKQVAGRWGDNQPKLADAKRKLSEGGTAAAASLAQINRYENREAIRSTRIPIDVGFERVTGPTIDLDDSPPSEQAHVAGLPVARIVELFDGNTIGEGFATGFLVGPDLLMTNWHVFANPGEARGCGAQFGFELNAQGLIESGSVFEIDPDRFFLSNRELDVTVIGLKRGAAIGAGYLRDFGRVQLIPSLGKILVGHRVSIIQHPDGRHKHWAVNDSRLLFEPTEDDDFLTYTTDTLPGSSGSPAFNHSWELVAVHHSGVPRMVNGDIMTVDETVWIEGMPESEIDWIGNEGARVSRVLAWLKNATMPDPEQQAILENLLAYSVDPLLSPDVGPGVASSTGLMDPIRGTNLHSIPNLENMNIVINGTANIYIGTESGSIDSGAKSHEPAAPNRRGLESRLKFDPDYKERPGYDPKFLWGKRVALPKANVNELVQKNGETYILKYHHYSLCMHKKRDLAMWTAANADFSSDRRWRKRAEFGEDTWKADPRIRGYDQLDDPEFYEPARKFDRGHIVGRASVAWGKTKQEEEYGNSDSFHWTNCSPQHEDFNRAIFGHKGLWGKLESHISNQSKFVGNRATILAGPVLDDSDPKRRFGDGLLIKVPMKFWKIVVVSEKVDGDYKLCAYGFVLDQTKAIDEFGWESRFQPKDFTVHQRSLADITTLSRVRFGDKLYQVDSKAGVNFDESDDRPVRSLEDIKLD